MSWLDWDDDRLARDQRDYEAKAEQNWWRAVSGENIYKTNYRKDEEDGNDSEE